MSGPGVKPGEVWQHGTAAYCGKGKEIRQIGIVKASDETVKSERDKLKKMGFLRSKTRKEGEK